MTRIKRSGLPFELLHHTRLPMDDGLRKRGLDGGAESVFSLWKEFWWAKRVGTAQ